MNNKDVNASLKNTFEEFSIGIAHIPKQMTGTLNLIKIELHNLVESLKVHLNPNSKEFHTLDKMLKKSIFVKSEIFNIIDILFPIEEVPVSDTNSEKECPLCTAKKLEKMTRIQITNGLVAEYDREERKIIDNHTANCKAIEDKVSVLKKEIDFLESSYKEIDLVHNNMLDNLDTSFNNSLLALDSLSGEDLAYADQITLFDKTFKKV